MKNRAKILSIAGFDPSGGAGILADIKTFEQHRCLGFAVQTSNTIQNENEFISPNWINQEVIHEQINTLTRAHKFDFIKIGLIEDLDFLEKTIERKEFKQSKIVWDPILSASAGFNFEHSLTRLTKILPQLYLITPNWNEIKTLSGKKDAIKGAQELALLTKVYLKGGHNSQDIGKDYLFENEKYLNFNPKSGSYWEKHGSGCVFSSSLISNLANSYPIQKAILRSKRYTERFLGSTKNKLGNHNH